MRGRICTLAAGLVLFISQVAWAQTRAAEPPTPAKPAAAPKVQPKVAPEPATPSTPVQAEEITLVRCGRLLSVPGQPAVKDVTLVIKNGIVDRIEPGFGDAAPKGANVSVKEIDLKDRFVLPGLIDCHVHLTMEFTPDLRERRITETATDAALRGIAYCRKNLEAGFTTVRDLGSVDGVAIAMRDAVKRGDFIGPRIIAAGKGISVTGGHGDPTNGMRSDLFGLAGADQGVADGSDECRKAVRYQVKLGADCIKLTATGGVLSASSAGLAQHFFSDELEAIVTTAHSMGRRVAAHAHGVDGINAALRAGVDSIEHGTYLDDESIRLFKEKGAYYVPTLLAGITVSKNAEIPGYYIAVVASKARLVGPKIVDACRRAREGGVKIAFGTDTGVSPHGQNAQEFALMVQAGMTPAEAIRAATVTASELLGLEKEIGTLEPGKAADVIAVAGDPLSDVKELERVDFVMRSGVVYKHAR